MVGNKIDEIFKKMVRKIKVRVFKDTNTTIETCSKSWTDIFNSLNRLQNRLDPNLV